MQLVLVRLSIIAVIWLCMAWPAQAADTLTVGSKRFTESLILAEVIAQTAAPHLPQPPVVKQGLGNTAIVYSALRSGAIDVYAEYSGTIALEILKNPKPGVRPGNSSSRKYARTAATLDIKSHVYED